MATKEQRREAQGLISGLESRWHAGHPVVEEEIVSLREYLHQKEFSASSEFFSRLAKMETGLVQRTPHSPGATKRNYGGEAEGRWFQVQSAFDHIILSTCYEGEFNLRQGKIKISHRFNREGRIDFVELKFLRSLQPVLNGACRKLILVGEYQQHKADWHAAEAFTLEVLPRELIFLFEDIFRCPRPEVLAWLINIGHGFVEDLLNSLRLGTVNGHRSTPPKSEQLCLEHLQQDEVAMPIMRKVVPLQACVEQEEPKKVLIRYLTTRP